MGKQQGTASKSYFKVSRADLPSLQPLVGLDWRQRFIWILLALFPVALVGIRGAGSVVYLLLALTGLFYIRREWGSLSQTEKHWLFGYLAFFLLGAFSLLYTEDLNEGVQRLDRLLRLATLAPVYLLIRHKQVEAAKPLVFGIFAAVMLMLGQALYEAYYLDQRHAAGIYHKIVFGDTAALFAALLLAVLLTVARKGWHYALLIPGIAAALFVSLLSATRGAWLFLLLLVPFLFWQYRRYGNPRIVRGAVIATLVAVVALAAWPPALIKKPLERGFAELEHYAEDSAHPGSWGTRLVLWRNSIEIWREHPLLGAGLGDFEGASKGVVIGSESDQRRYMELTEAVEKAQQEIRRLQPQARKLNRQKKELQQKIGEHQEAIRQIQNGTDVDTESSIEGHRQAIQRLQEQLQEAKRPLQKLWSELKGHREAVKKYRHELNTRWPGWQTLQYNHAHSIYFDMLARLGGIGLALVVIVLFILPYRLFARRWQTEEEPWRRFSALAGLVTVFAFAVFGLSEGWISRNPFVIPYIVLLAVFSAYLAIQGNSDSRGAVSEKSRAAR